MSPGDSANRPKTKDAHTPVPQRIRLFCPKCNRRVIDQRPGFTTTLHTMKEGDNWPADYYMKCPHCRVEIGIRRTE